MKNYERKRLIYLSKYEDKKPAMVEFTKSWINMFKRNNPDYYPHEMFTILSSKFNDKDWILEQPESGEVVGLAITNQTINITEKKYIVPVKYKFFKNIFGG